MAKRPRKSRVYIDSDSAESDGNSEEDTNIPKKRRPDIEKPAASVPVDTSDSESSSSDVEWTERGSVPKRKKKAPASGTVSSAASSSSSSSDDSEAEEGEVSSSDGDDCSLDEMKFFEGLDDNLRGDAEDRARLDQMTEKQREEELYNRIEKMEILKRRYEIKQHLNKAKKQEQKSKSNRHERSQYKKDPKVRSMERRKTMDDKKSIKQNAIQRLKEERAKKKQTAEAIAEQTKKLPLKVTDIYSDDDEDDENKDAQSSPLYEKSSESDSVEEKEEEPTRFIQSVEELNKMRISRHKIEKWCHAPFFARIIVNCFIRVGIGTYEGEPIYRVAEVIGVVETAKIYALGNTRTNKGLKVRYAMSEKVFRLEFVSNTDITNDEFVKWMTDMKSSSLQLPTHEDMLKIQKRLIEMSSYHYKEEDIDIIIQEKNKFRENPRNYAVKKTELIKAKEKAQQDEDYDELQKLQGELEVIEEQADSLYKERTKNMSAISYINQRNRQRNLVEAEKAVVTEFQEMKNKASDPFTRLKSRPTLVTKSPTMSSRPAVDANANNSKNPSTPTPSLAKQTISEVKNDKENKKSTPKPNEDLYSVHDFDINIDLTIGFDTVDMNLNSQLPCKNIKDETPRRSLNLDDYKRRKGLL